MIIGEIRRDFININARVISIGYCLENKQDLQVNVQLPVNRIKFYT